MNEPGVGLCRCLVTSHVAGVVVLAILSGLRCVVELVELGFTPTDAYCLVSTCPDFRINVYQMCKIRGLSFVAGAELPKRYLLG